METACMHTETERKFLVLNDSFLAEATAALRIAQGYIAHDGGNTVRVRLRDGQGILTIKGPSRDGLSRAEWEMEIPLQDATDLFALCKSGRVEKIRHIVPAGNGRCFEVDEFLGDNEGLVMAEIELGSEDEAFVRPDWLGEEVTGDRRYYNSYLSARPFKTW
jgi:CYTH domain-containing protein